MPQCVNFSARWSSQQRRIQSYARGREVCREPCQHLIRRIEVHKGTAAGWNPFLWTCYELLARAEPCKLDSTLVDHIWHGHRLEMPALDELWRKHVAPLSTLAKGDLVTERRVVDWTHGLRRHDFPVDINQEPATVCGELKLRRRGQGQESGLVLLVHMHRRLHRMGPAKADGTHCRGWPADGQLGNGRAHALSSLCRQQTRVKARGDHVLLGVAIVHDLDLQ
mmetsp:Transcript_35830/g.94137  ORF Transcript_35830/g.94137 Transcript_35830/m.94137 type:complete len:223 (+) Transcript_35830:312-980(+)